MFFSDYFPVPKFNSKGNFNHRVIILKVNIELVFWCTCRRGSKNIFQGGKGVRGDNFVFLRVSEAYLWDFYNVNLINLKSRGGGGGTPDPYPFSRSAHDMVSPLSGNSKFRSLKSLRLPIAIRVGSSLCLVFRLPCSKLHLSFRANLSQS